MTVPSTQSIVLIVIQLMADSRRHNYQHRYYKPFLCESQPYFVVNQILFRLRSPFFVPLFKGSQIVFFRETGAGAGVLFLAAITRILHNHKPPVQSAL